MESDSFVVGSTDHCDSRGMLTGLAFIFKGGPGPIRCLLIRVFTSDKKLGKVRGLFESQERRLGDIF